MDYRTYQKIRSYCWQDLAAYLDLDKEGYAAVRQMWVKLDGPVGAIRREEQQAHNLFGCSDLTPRENAAACLLAIISNHRAITWQREAKTPDGRPPAASLEPSEAAALTKQTNDAISEYAAFVPEREAAALLALRDGLTTSAPQVTPSAAPAETPPDATKVYVPRDDADVIINAALDAVKPATDAATVWAQLQKMAEAKEKPGTLLGMVDGELKYMKKGVVTFYTRDAVAKKLNRRKTP